MTQRTAIQTPQQAQTTPAPTSGILQRQCACGNHTVAGGECATCKEKRHGVLQRSPNSLTINRPGDRYEQEADRVATAVISGEMLPGRTLNSPPALRRDGPPPVPSPRDPSADELRKAPGTSLPDLGFNEPKNDQHVQQPSEKPETNEDRLGTAGEKLAETFLETTLGKQLTDQAEKFGEGFISTLPGLAVSLSIAASTVATMALRNEEFPLKGLVIKLPQIAPGLKVKLTYKGPLSTPTEADISFAYEPEAAKKPQVSDTDRTRAETERLAADQAKFQKGAKTPAERAAEQRQLDAIVRGRQAQSGNILGIPGLTPRRDNPALQRDANGSGDLSVAPPIVHEVLNSPGQPLDPATRSFMEPRFGHDFSRVRVHTDDRAAASARDVSANAYTVGDNVVFGAGRFTPGTHEGRRLIAHELTHVIQQSGSQLKIGVQRKQGNRAPLSSIQGLPMSALLIELMKLPETVLDDEEEGQLVGGPRLVVAMQAVRAKLQRGLADFLQNSRVALQALPADQSIDILKFLAAPAETKSQKLNNSSADKIVGVPMGGTYEDYKKDPDYLDNFSSAGYDPHSNTLHLFYTDGGEAVLKLPLLSVGGNSLLVFERKTLLDTPGANDYKIYPTVPNSKTLPTIAQWLTDHAEEIQQSNLLLRSGMGALEWRSTPPNLWWLNLLAPIGGLGARFASGRMRPAFKTVKPEPGEIPIIKAPAKAGTPSEGQPITPTTKQWAPVPRPLQGGGGGNRVRSAQAATPATSPSQPSKAPGPKAASTAVPKPGQPLPKVLAPGMSTGEADESAALSPSRPNATLLGEKAGGYDATEGGKKIVNSEVVTKDKAGNPIIVRDITLSKPDDAIQIKTITQLDKYGQPSVTPLPTLVADNVKAALAKAYNQPATRSRARTPLPGTNIYERTNVEAPKKITIIVQVPGAVTKEMRDAAAKVLATDTRLAELPPVEVIVQARQVEPK